MKTGSRSASSMPIAMPRSGNSKPFGSWSAGRTRGRRRTAGAADPYQWDATVCTSRAVASARSSGEEEESMRGSAVMKCSFSGT